MSAVQQVIEKLRDEGMSWAEIGDLLGCSRAQARDKGVGRYAPNIIEEAMARALLAACEPRAPRDVRRLLERSKAAHQ